jgi:hypothetical protein
LIKPLSVWRDLIKPLSVWRDFAAALEIIPNRYITLLRYAALLLLALPRAWRRGNRFGTGYPAGRAYRYRQRAAYRGQGVELAAPQWLGAQLPVAKAVGGYADDGIGHARVLIVDVGDVDDLGVANRHVVDNARAAPA